VFFGGRSRADSGPSESLSPGYLTSLSERAKSLKFCQETKKNKPVARFLTTTGDE
jgi:hypothetical protein